MTCLYNIYNIYHIFLIYYLGLWRDTGEMWAHKHYTFMHIRAFFVLVAAYLHPFASISLKNGVIKFSAQKSLENLLKIHFRSVLPPHCRHSREPCRISIRPADHAKSRHKNAPSIRSGRPNHVWFRGASITLPGKASTFYRAAVALCRHVASILRASTGHGQHFAGTLARLSGSPARRPLCEICLYRAFGPSPRPC